MESKPLLLALYVEEVNFILYALSKLPYDEVNLLITKLQAMASDGIKAHNINGSNPKITEVH
jgi:hypothetical protein